MKNLIPLMSVAILAGCANSGNPFLSEFNTPYGVPPFEQIKNEHYLPAFRSGMEQQWQEIGSINANTAAPSFENTVAAFANSGEALRRVNYVFNNLYDAESSPAMDAVANEVTPMLAKHRDSILLNEGLFARIKAVYEQQNAAKTLQGEDARLLGEIYTMFVRGGANLDAASKAKLSKVNQALSVASLKFQQNTLAETNGFQLIFGKDTKPSGTEQGKRVVITGEENMAGLPQGIRDQAQSNGKWVFTLKNPSIMPFLQYADGRELRQTMLGEYSERGNHDNEYDNKALIGEIVRLRLEKAGIMGYNTYADYVLDNCMAKNPKNVYDLLGTIWQPALAKAKQEREEQQKLIAADTPSAALTAADWRYYAEKIRKQNYALDDEQLRPYFKLDNVLQKGVFTLLNKLFGVEFASVQVPVYHKDVACYAVIEGGDTLGLVYVDFFPRAGKRGGAWMTDFREQRYDGDKRVMPIVSLVFNFTPPSGDTPSLLTEDEVETMFHEFGHATHSLFSKCRYRWLAGTNTTRDYVELPSQILENWAFSPELLKSYALQYQTGEVIPADLVEKITRSSQYGQGFATTELIAAALLDMDYHTLTSAENLDVIAFEKNAMDKIGLIPEILPRYRSTYFNHVFSGTGYDAGYYSYLWAEVLDADGFEAFKETGDIFNQDVAKRYRTYILERGNSEEPMVLYEKFRRGQPKIDALLKRRGLK